MEMVQAGQNHHALTVGPLLHAYHTLVLLPFTIGCCRWRGLVLSLACTRLLLHRHSNFVHTAGGGVVLNLASDSGLGQQQALRGRDLGNIDADLSLLLLRCSRRLAANHGATTLGATFSSGCLVAPGSRYYYLG